MDIQVVQQTLSSGVGRFLHLLQEPRQEVGVGMGLSIGPSNGAGPVCSGNS